MYTVWILDWLEFILVHCGEWYYCMCCRLSLVRHLWRLLFIQLFSINVQFNFCIKFYWKINIHSCIQDYGVQLYMLYHIYITVMSSSTNTVFKPGILYHETLHVCLLQENDAFWMRQVWQPTWPPFHWMVTGIMETPGGKKVDGNNLDTQMCILVLYTHAQVCRFLQMMYTFANIWNWMIIQAVIWPCCCQPDKLTGLFMKILHTWNG